MKIKVKYRCLQSLVVSIRLQQQVKCRNEIAPVISISSKYSNMFASSWGLNQDLAAQIQVKCRKETCLQAPVVSSGLQQLRIQVKCMLLWSRLGAENKYVCKLLWSQLGSEYCMVKYRKQTLSKVLWSNLCSEIEIQAKYRSLQSPVVSFGCYS